MANVLFTNVRIIDATGAQPYMGDVLVQGNRIARVGRGARSLPAASPSRSRLSPPRSNGGMRSASTGIRCSETPTRRC